MLSDRLKTTNYQSIHGHDSVNDIKANKLFITTNKVDVSFVSWGPLLRCILLIANVAYCFRISCT